MRAARRRPPWLFLSVLAMGAAVAVGGFVTYADQSSGTPGKAKVSECTGGRKYQPAIRCRGTWVTGGALVGGDGRVVVGQVEGAGYGDVGKTIDVRIHGTDHATKPSLTTPLVLWGLGGGVALLALVGLVGWWPTAESRLHERSPLDVGRSRRHLASKRPSIGGPMSKPVEPLRGEAAWKAEKQGIAARNEQAYARGRKERAARNTAFAARRLEEERRSNQDLTHRRAR